MADHNMAEENSSLTSSKKMQYAKLHAELAKLNDSVQAFERHIKDTVEQVPSFRQMGNLHASLFMSVNKVIQPNTSSTNNTRQ